MHAGETERLVTVQMSQQSQTGTEGLEDSLVFGPYWKLSSDGSGGSSNRGNELNSKEQRQTGQHSSTFPLDLFACWTAPSGGRGMVFCPQLILSRSTLTDLPRSMSLLIPDPVNLATKINYQPWDSES